MKFAIKDKKYLTLVNHILMDDDFNKLKKFYHHGTTRLEHSLRVSYVSYKIAKLLGLDYKVSAISGLLHDFFENYGEKTISGFFKHQMKHPKIASNNAKLRFNISNKEQEIIETHMFPLTLRPSRYIEGWLVSFVDKAIGTYEHGVKFKYQLTLWLIFLFNLVRQFS